MIEEREFYKDNWREKPREGVDGIVKGIVVGGPEQIVGDVKNGVVYNRVCGGPNQAIGFIENGVAYDFTIGGPHRVIGMVELFYNN